MAEPLTPTYVKTWQRWQAFEADAAARGSGATKDQMTGAAMMLGWLFDKDILAARAAAPAGEVCANHDEALDEKGLQPPYPCHAGYVHQTREDAVACGPAHFRWNVAAAPPAVERHVDAYRKGFNDGARSPSPDPVAGLRKALPGALHEVGGEFCDPFDPDHPVAMHNSQAAALAALLDSPDPAAGLREALGAAARERDELREALIAILTTGEYARMEAEGKAADMLGLVWPENGDHYVVGVEA